MKRRTAALLIVPMLLTVCSCGSSSAPGTSVLVDTTINGRRAPDANGNNRDQPTDTGAPSPTAAASTP